VTLLAVIAAGAVGAASRFVLDHAIGRMATGRLPVGTLVVNVTGSAAAGVLAGLAARHSLDEALRVVVGTGFLAAFTTYSTFAVETVRLAEDGGRRAAAVHAGAHLVLTVGAAGLGYAALTAV
jgi:fluoride exporter